MATHSNKHEHTPEAVVGHAEKISHVANDALMASAGAVAGGIVGAIAGPAGVVAGASLGALAGGLLQHQADREQHEKATYDAEIDDIDVEEEFFHEARALGAEAPQFDDTAEPIEALRVFKQEHREIERLLLALESWAEGSSPDTLEAGRFASVLQGFVAQWHHAREEDVLFDTLQRTVGERERGMVLAITHEHRLLDALAEELAELGRSPGSWTALQRERAVTVATQYADLLRNDMRQEEGVLHPLAQSLPASAIAAMNTLLENIEPPAGTEPIETLRRTASSLCAAYLRPSGGPLPAGSR